MRIGGSRSFLSGSSQTKKGHLLQATYPIVYRDAIHVNDDG